MSKELITWLVIIVVAVILIKFIPFWVYILGIAGFLGYKYRNVLTDVFRSFFR